MVIFLVFTGCSALGEPPEQLSGGWHQYSLPDEEFGEDISAMACAYDKAFVATRFGELFEWTGRSLSKIERTYNEADGRWIWASPDGQLFTNDGKKVSRLQNRTWKTYSIEFDEHLYGPLWGASAQEVYGVSGGRIGLIMDGEVRLFFPGTWREFRAIWGTSGSDIFIGGQGGVIMHHDGRNWTKMKSGTDKTIVGLWGTATDDVWAWTIDDKILRWNGKTWSDASSGFVGRVKAIGGGDPEGVYAVGGSAIMKNIKGRWTMEFNPHDRCSWPVAVCTTVRDIIIACRNQKILVKRR